MILLLSDDLIDASKTTAVARTAGIPIVQFKSPEGLLQALKTLIPNCIILDLQCPGLSLTDMFAPLKNRAQPAVIAYGSHVDAARLKAAREAGCDPVMPRSKYFDSIPEIIGTIFPSPSHDPPINGPTTS